jgi:L-ribulose-5-phosphate 3-epimerase
MTHSPSHTRRHFMKRCAAGAGSLYVANAMGAFRSPLSLAEDEPVVSGAQYQLGICDWTMGIRCDTSAFQQAKELGFDGIQLTFDPIGETNLREAATQKTFLEEAEGADCAIASLAMGILNSRPFADDPDSEKWVDDCIDVMAAMEQEQVLLAFFGAGDLKDRPDKEALAIERLKRLAPKAERLGKILAVESYLNAAEHMRIIDAVGSDAVRIYYDVANMTKMGYDIFAEIRELGSNGLISQVHLKENGERFGEGVIDFPKVRRSLDAIEYQGWLIAEGGTKGDRDESLRQNAAYAREVFGLTTG